MPRSCTCERSGSAYPGAHTKSPWPGHLDLAVNDKTFAYLTVEGEPFRISCKLPHTGQVALMLPFCTPTGYGLGKSGWVSAAPPPEQPIPIELFEAWIEESYRAQAPKRLVAQLGASPGRAPAPVRTPAPRRRRPVPRAPRPAPRTPGKASSRQQKR